MDNIEAVKDILQRARYSYPDGSPQEDEDELVRELCQLFEAKPDEKLYKQFPVKRRHIVNPSTEPYKPAGTGGGTNAVDYLKGYTKFCGHEPQCETAAVHGKRLVKEALNKPSAHRLLTDVELLQKMLGLPDISTITEHAAQQDMAVPPGSYFKAGAKAQRDLTASIMHQEYASQKEHLAHLVDDVIKLEEKLKGKDAERQARVEQVTRELYLKASLRVEGIKKKIESHAYKGGKSFCRLILARGDIEIHHQSDWWEKLWKEEGI